MKFLRIFGSATMIAAMLAVNTASAYFTHVSDYAQEAVETFQEMGLLEGVQLSAKTNAKRSDVVRWLVNSLDVQLYAPTSATYKDVPKSHPDFAHIETATALGLVQGDTDAFGNTLGTFRPDSEVKRAEIAKMIIFAYDLAPTSLERTVFADVHEGKWYYDSVLTAYEHHVVNGFLHRDGSPTGLFKPSQKVSNQDAIVMMFRAWDQFAPAYDNDTPYLPKEDVENPPVDEDEEPVSETSADWRAYSDSGLGLVSTFFLPKMAEVTEFSTEDGAAVGIVFEENYLYEGRLANVDSIYLSQVPTAPGQSAFQKAQYDFEELETWAAFLPDQECKLKNPVYGKLIGESEEIITVKLLVTCGDNESWEEAVLAYSGVGNDGMFFAAFGNEGNLGAVEEALRIDYDGFVTDFLKMLRFRYRG